MIRVVKMNVAQPTEIVVLDQNFVITPNLLQLFLPLLRLLLLRLK